MRDQNIIEDAIREYDKYHFPEANTKLVSISDKSFKIEFSGLFCYTCGFYDYFDDYKILLEEKGLKAVISEINEGNEKAVVAFEILDSL